MRPLFPISIIFIALLLFACKKEDDPCEEVSCLNGGVCVEGDCSCLGGYSGDQCELFDSCFNVNCLNGGVCEDGICDCPTGYTGSDCGEQITPSQIRFTKIIMERWPENDSGVAWDIFPCGDSRADVYLTLQDRSGIFLVTDHINDCTPTRSYAYDESSGLPVSSFLVEDFLILRLFDHDDANCAPDDFMGGLFGPMYDSTNGFPERYRFRNFNAQIDVTFFLEYEF